MLSEAITDPWAAHQEGAWVAIPVLSNPDAPDAMWPMGGISTEAAKRFPEVATGYPEYLRANPGTCLLPLVHHASRLLLLPVCESPGLPVDDARVEAARKVVVASWQQWTGNAPLLVPLWNDPVYNQFVEALVQALPVATSLPRREEQEEEQETSSPLAASSMNKLEAAFWEFHTSCPEVYSTLVTLAREWRQCTNKRKLGLHMLYQRARWEMSLRVQDSLGFKLNNNYVPFYARLIMLQEEDLADAFDLRKQKFQASFGPANALLPSGDHVS